MNTTTTRVVGIIAGVIAFNIGSIASPAIQGMTAAQAKASGIQARADDGYLSELEAADIKTAIAAKSAAKRCGVKGQSVPKHALIVVGDATVRLTSFDKGWYWFEHPQAAKAARVQLVGFCLD